MKIGRHILRPRAFILIAVLLIAILGVRIGEQGKAIRSEDGGYEISRQVSSRFEDSYRSSIPIQATIPGVQGTMRAAYSDKLSEHGYNAKIQETSSYPVLACRGSSGISDRGYSNVFDTPGIQFKITAYTAGYESTGKRSGDKGYGITYSGNKVKENHTIAADLTILPLGTKVIIEGLDTVFTVEDKGAAVKGNHIDMYIPALKEALKWGVQYKRIIVLERGLEDGK